MPVIHAPNRPSAAVERVSTQNNTQPEDLNSQLYMTYRVVTDPIGLESDVWDKIDAKCVELGCSAAEFFAACAEHILEME
jgi:hypothetical protein